jgi:hypothetical protein
LPSPGVEIKRIVVRGRGRLAEALSRARNRIDARGRLAEWAGRMQVLRAEHPGFSTAATVSLLLVLALAGTGVGVLAAGDRADAVAVNYTMRSVTVTTPAGTLTYEVMRTQEVTITEKRKGANRSTRANRSTVRTRTVTGPESVTTLRQVDVLPGQFEQLPGQTTTIAGPGNTVTVRGPGQTVTQVVTDVVTVTNEVVVTVTETETVTTDD